MNLVNDFEDFTESDEDFDLEDRDNVDEDFESEEDNSMEQLIQGEKTVDSKSEAPPVYFTKRRVYWNILAVLLLSFAGEASRGLVIPSLWPYVNSMGGSQSFYGECVSLFSITRFIGSVGMGYLSDFVSIKLISMISIAICLIGNLIYSLATLSPSYGKWIILVSRGILGIGTSVVIVVRTQIAVVSPADRRTRFFSWGAAAGYMGMALTPGLGTLLAHVNFNIGSWAINGNSSPGFFLMFFYIPVLIATHFTMDDVTGATKISHEPQEASLESPQETSIESPEEAPIESPEEAPIESPQETTLGLPQEETSAQPEDDESDLSKPPPVTKPQDNPASTGFPMWVNIGFFVFVNFTARICIALVETTGTPMFLEATGQTSTIESIASASEFFEALGFGGLLVFPCLEWIEKVVSGSLMLNLSFILIAVGCFLQTPYGGQPASFPLFAVGNTLIWSIASPITQVLVVSGLVSILGGQPPGRFLAMIAGGGSVARMLGPIFATTAPYIVVFPVIGSLAILTSILLTFFYFRSKNQNNS